MKLAGSSKADIAARVLGNMTVVPPPQVEARLLPELADLDRPTTLGFLNAHGINLCWNDPEIARNFASLDYLLRDGIGVEICCTRLGWDSGANLNGTDFIPRLLDHLRGTVALFGTQAPWLDDAASELAARGLEIVTTHHGFEEPEFYVERVMTLRPEVIVLAMGMPKQEQVAAMLKEAADWPALIICGGAILDWIAGRFARAPEFIRRHHLEWAYRLFKEPKRLFRRYVIGNPQFLMRLPTIVRAVERTQITPKRLSTS